MDVRLVYPALEPCVVCKVLTYLFVPQGFPVCVEHLKDRNGD